jgi:hypothetical protein
MKDMKELNLFECNVVSAGMSAKEALGWFDVGMSHDLFLKIILASAFTSALLLAFSDESN